MAHATQENERLGPLIGEWSMALVMPEQEAPNELTDVGAKVTFEWVGDRAFVLQRWTVPLPQAPDGLAVIGWDDGRGTFLQHYFDERAVARTYRMGFDGGVWTLERTRPDFSPFEFSQRFTGVVADDGTRIDGSWEVSHDHKTWAKDFDLVYSRLRSTGARSPLGGAR